MVVLVGVVAGAMTTITGTGGGLFITLVLSLVWGPHAALATGATALLVGNLHRLWTLRHSLETRVMPVLAVGGLVGAAIGGLVTAAASPATIRWLLVAVTILAAVKAAGWVRFELSRAALVPGGLAVGFVSATTGGGGLLLAPLMLTAGLRDLAFLSTGTTVAISLHVGAVGSYASAGMLDGRTFVMAAALAVGIVAGNETGFRVRPKIPERWREASTWIVLVSGLVLALAGLAGPR